MLGMVFLSTCNRLVNCQRIAFMTVNRASHLIENFRFTVILLALQWYLSTYCNLVPLRGTIKSPSKRVQQKHCLFTILSLDKSKCFIPPNI